MSIIKSGTIPNFVRDLTLLSVTQAPLSWFGDFLWFPFRRLSVVGVSETVPDLSGVLGPVRGSPFQDWGSGSRRPVLVFSSAKRSWSPPLTLSVLGFRCRSVPPASLDFFQWFPRTGNGSTHGPPVGTPSPLSPVDPTSTPKRKRTDVQRSVHELKLKGYTFYADCGRWRVS